MFLSPKYFFVSLGASQRCMSIPIFLILLNGHKKDCVIKQYTHSPIPNMNLTTITNVPTNVPAEFFQTQFPELLKNIEAASEVLTATQLKAAFADQIAQVEQAWNQVKQQEAAAKIVQTLGPKALSLYEAGELIEMEAFLTQNDKALWALSQLAAAGNQKASSLLIYLNTKGTFAIQSIQQQVLRNVQCLSVSQRKASVQEEAGRLALAKAAEYKKTTAQQWLHLYLQAAQMLLNEQYKGDLSDWIREQNEYIIKDEKSRRCAPLANDWWGKKEKASIERQVDKEATQQLQRAVLVHFPEPKPRSESEEGRVQV